MQLRKNSSPSLPSLFFQPKQRLISIESHTFFDYRTQPQHVVIANRPLTDSHDTLELELSPSWDKQGLAGYQFFTTGEANFSVELPSELSRNDLGSKLAIKVVGRDFLFAMHQPR